MRGGDPASVGVEEEEENHAESHEVHVDAEDDASVIEAPAALHATDGVGGAGDGEEDGKDEEGSGAVVGEVREEERDAETDEYEEAAASKRVGTRIEEGMFHVGCVCFKDTSVMGLALVRERRGVAWLRCVQLCLM